VRQNGRIVSVAVIIAVGVNTDGRREVLGMQIGASEAETFWSDFLRSLTRRGLRGVKLAISDAHEGLKGAISIRRGSVAASISRATPWRMREKADAGWSRPSSPRRLRKTMRTRRAANGAIADQLKPKLPKLSALMNDAEANVLAYMSFPREHRTKCTPFAVSTRETDRLS
jgi:putative transposase